MSFASPHSPKQWLNIAVPSHTRIPSPVKVQVRSSWHLSLSTRWLHQGCDRPPHTGKQWPAPLSSVRPSGWSLPVRMRSRTRGMTRGGRPRCAVRSPLHPVSRCRKGRKRFSPFRAPQNNHTPDSSVFSICDQPQHVPNNSAWPR